MKSPFPYFGSKSKVTKIIWDAFGDVQHYIEPFFGSGVVLLNRPSHHLHSLETVNELDPFLTNLWRSLAFSPELTFKWCDWPINEVDLHSRHSWLIEEGKQKLVDLRMESDPFAHDSQIAGWWLWGISQWIGDGWTQFTSNKKPHLMNKGKGIHRSVYKDEEDLQEYFKELTTRLRKVRILHGDWSRAVTPALLSMYSPKETGIFLDPPYEWQWTRSKKQIYNYDSTSLSQQVREWCLANSQYKIVLAGLEEEHDPYIPSTWKREFWRTSKGYSKDVAYEMLWFSPSCEEFTVRTLFEAEEV